MSETSYLDDQQEKAASAKERLVVVLAAAGSGKTRTIVGRVNYLRDAGIDLGRVVVTTFTKKAVGELKERLSSVPSNGSSPNVFTFHSLSWNLLTRIHHPITRSPSPFVESRRRLLRDSLIEIRGKGNFGIKEIKICDHVITIAQNEMWSPEDVSQKLPGYIASVYKLYQEKKAIRNQIDYDDCQTLLLQSLRTDTQSRKQLFSFFDYWLVDEAQDLSPSQGAIVDEIASTPSISVALVGDDYQSIYAFRAAKPDYLIEKAENRDAWSLYRIDTNYRSTEPIVKAGNALIAHNTYRSQKTAIAFRKVGSRPQVLEFNSRQEENRSLIEWILRNGPRRPTVEVSNWETSAVLLRLNRLVREREISLVRKGIPYAVLGRPRQPILEMQEIAPLRGWMLMICDDRNADALFAAYTAPNRFLRRNDCESVVSRSKSVGLLMATNERQEEGWQDIARDLLELRRILKQSPSPSSFLSRVLDIRSSISNESLKESLLRRAIEVSEDNDDVDIAGGESSYDDSLLPLVEEIAASCSDVNELLSNFLKPQLPPGEPIVEIGTIHQAKGLEWNHVWLPVWCDGIIPDYRALEAIESGGESSLLEEERRLAYVAITRAKDTLTISHYPAIDKTRNALLRSRFISEALGEVEQPKSISARGIFVSVIEFLKYMFSLTLNPELVNRSLQTQSLKQPSYDWGEIETETPVCDPVRRLKYSTSIAGALYKNDDGTERWTAIAGCKVGEKVHLIRDPSNRYDSGAVKICLSDGRQIGFVPKGIAARIAPLLDSGIELSCVITKIRGYGKDMCEVDIAEIELPAQHSEIANTKDFADSRKTEVCSSKQEKAPQHLQNTFEALRVNAEKGDADAQHDIGVCYALGKGVVRDLEQAAIWYRKAADQGHSPSQYNLGVCYERGEGVQKNMDESAYWFRKAAVQGHIAAQHRLKSHRS